MTKYSTSVLAALSRVSTCPQLTGKRALGTRVSANQIWLLIKLFFFFPALDHGKALVYEHSKRLLINLIIVLVCRGDHVSLAQSLFNFITISEQGLGKYGLLKSSWTLDVANIVGVAVPSAGAGTGAESSVESNDASAGTGTSE